MFIKPLCRRFQLELACRIIRKSIHEHFGWVESDFGWNLIYSMSCFATSKHILSTSDFNLLGLRKPCFYDFWLIRTYLRSQKTISDKLFFDFWPSGRAAPQVGGGGRMDTFSKISLNLSLIAARGEHSSIRICEPSGSLWLESSYGVIL